MAKFNTQNKLGSTDPRDFLDNSQIADDYVNNKEDETVPDRFGSLRKTWFGMESIFRRLINTLKSQGDAAISAIGWQELGDWEVGLTLTDRRQIVLFEGAWYKYLGDLNHTISGESPSEDGGVWSSVNVAGLWVNIGDAALRNELSAKGGASLVHLQQGGTLQNAIFDIYIDAFGADPTGTTDSTPAVLAAIAAIGGPTDSAYVPATTKYANIIFGNGKYIIGDIPFISGVTFKGQGKLQTQIIPKVGASYCFTVAGVADYYADTTSWSTIKRCMNAGLENMSIMPYASGQVGSVVPGVGGVYIAYASYFRMVNVVIDNLSGCGLWQEQLWDADITDVRITSCGLGSTDDNIIPSIYLGMGTTVSVDGSNAIRYRGLHLENSPRLMYLDRYSRHVFFTSPKIEGTNSKYTSIIDGAYGVLFDCAELTWQFPSTPMFTIVRSTDSRDSRGVIFQSPVCISSPTTSKHGWYFRHSSNYGVLQLNNVHCENVSTLASGTNILINGGSTWNCGPNFANGNAYFAIKDLINRAIIFGSANDGSQDFITLSGGGIQLLNNSFEGAGATTNNQAYINITGVTSAAVITGNIFAGVTQYGVRQTARYQDVLVSDNTATVTLGSLNSSGYYGKSVSEMWDSASIANDAAYTSKILVGRCTQVRIYFTATDRQSSAILLMDSLTSQVVIMGTNGTSGTGRFKNGGTSTGASADGYIYIKRNDSGYIEITNHSGYSGTLTIKAII